MGKVIAGMTMSLDGYIDADKVNPDFEALLETASFKQMIENTGAAIMGRRVYEMANPFLWANDDYEFQTPIFVLTHTPPEKFPPGNGKLSFTFVTDGVESAVAQAKAAAGDKDVQIIGGASTIQQCLNAGLCDELQIDVMPVLLGKGLQLFEHIDTKRINLERTKVEATTSYRTSITYTVTS
ncbi:MAG: dihydrofolate reductase family protein [Patescibacteria group bacterium]|nr:dihydrofolate reductase family protein [Patescibacteria group bacterium]